MRLVICCASLIVGPHVVADDLQVDRRRNAEVQNLADDIGRLKEELRAGKLLGESFAQLIDVIAGGHPAVFLQADQNFANRIRQSLPNCCRWC